MDAFVYQVIDCDDRRSDVTKELVSHIYAVSFSEDALQYLEHWVAVSVLMSQEDNMLLGRNAASKKHLIEDIAADFIKLYHVYDYVLLPQKVL